MWQRSGGSSKDAVNCTWLVYLEALPAVPYATKFSFKICLQSYIYLCEGQLEHPSITHYLQEIQFILLEELLFCIQDF